MAKRVFAVINQKGGAGKTTTAVNLSAALGELGKKILLVDLDAQRSASVWCGCVHEDLESDNLLDVIMGKGELEKLVTPTEMPGIDLIPATESLLGAEAEMSKEMGAEFGLREQISKLPDKWDYIFLDCPPELKRITMAGMIAATDIMIVTRPGMLDLLGVATLKANIERAQNRVNPNLKLFGVLVCQADRRTGMFRSNLELLRQNFPDKVFETIIRSSVRFGECPSYGMSILQFDPRGNGAADYSAAAQEFLVREAGN